jgi:hypothetical protein
MGLFWQRRAPLLVAIGVQRGNASDIWQVGDAVTAVSTLRVLEEQQLSAMVAMKNLHIRK